MNLRRNKLLNNKDVVKENYHLMLGDCLERMKEIPDGSIDLILTDPPYATTKNKWDSIIPFEPMWDQLKRIIKPKGVIVLFAQTPFDKILGASNIGMLKYEWVWFKNRPTGHLNSKFAPLKSHENILVFTKGSTSFVKNTKNSSTYNPQGLVACLKVNKRTRGNGNYDEVNNKMENVALFENYPKSVLSFKVEVGLHPTQKPVALLEYLIKTYTNEGDTVLDFTFGSGSTCVAALNTNRKFKGVEMNEGYFNIAVERINMVVNQSY